jgi:hypothetical protein
MILPSRHRQLAAGTSEANKALAQPFVQFSAETPFQVIISKLLKHDDKK